MGRRAQDCCMTSRWLSEEPGSDHRTLRKGGGGELEGEGR